MQQQQSKIAFFLALTLTAALGYGTLAQAQDTGDDLIDLSLDELLDLNVTSVSKRAQSVMEAAAAVYVITNDDIRRSGATSLPDALSLAPGVSVARIDASKWAVGVRGSGARFANNLLVLVDGRSVYSNLFGGTFWDMQDVLLDDVDRIEVIRGPGASLWGSNAVNGVINIITRNAGNTQGLLVNAMAGDQEQGIAGLRYGGALGEVGNYRIYARHIERDGNELVNGMSTPDEVAQSRLGFRADLTPGSRDTVMVEGSYFRGDADEFVDSITPVPPFQMVMPSQHEVKGGEVLARWTRTRSNSDQFTLQSYYDYADRNWFLAGFERDILDLYADYRIQRIEGHNIVAGAGYRLIDSNITTTALVATIQDHRDEDIYNLFLQDQIELIPGRLSTIIGSKFENNPFSGWEIQPTLRLLWNPNTRHSIWAAVSRAVRTPTRGDRDYRLLTAIDLPDSPMAPPVFLFSNGSTDFKAEETLAWEAGWKLQPTGTLSVEFAAFYNETEGLRAFTLDPPRCFPAGEVPACFADPNTIGLSVDARQTNGADLDSWGLEANFNWYPASRWRIAGNYSYLSQDRSADPGTLDAGEPFEDPAHLANLRLSFNPVSNLSTDLWLQYRSESRGNLGIRIDNYSTVNARIAWQASPKLELSLVGQNLFESAQAQAASELQDIPLTEISNAAYVQMRVNF